MQLATSWYGEDCLWDFLLCCYSYHSRETSHVLLNIFFDFVVDLAEMDKILE